MTTTLIFLSGTGVGMLISTTVMLGVISGLTGKKNRMKQDEYNELTTRLMQERNDTDGRIAFALENLSEIIRNK